MSPDLLRQISAWLEQDPDAQTRAELEALVADNNEAELQSRFGEPLRFGTAGLRAKMGAGLSCMNRSVVAQASWALGMYLETAVATAKSAGVCVGYDGRTHSEAFAYEAASVLAGLGFRVFLFDEPVPTPLLAFAVLHHKAAAGVMITASHNPPSDNGYKVYWQDGAQINTPHDGGIEVFMQNVPSYKDMLHNDVAPQTRLTSSMTDAYLTSIKRSGFQHTASGSLAIAYTALHGVGETLLRRTLKEFGFTNVFSVTEQAKPDGTFPTVAFPNPEEQGAMDRVFELAQRVQADLILANDPDADRLAVAVAHNGRFVRLTGNELGILLADYVLKHTVAQRPCVISTLVSSPWLVRIAEGYNAHAEQTLTGFKWIMRRAHELEAQGYTFVYGYEEALGYCIGHTVRDKDGIRAALVVADMAHTYAANGKSLIDHLDHLYQTYGVHIDAQVSIRFSGPKNSEILQSRMEHLRKHPPTHIAHLPVIQQTDYLQSSAPQLPSTNMVKWDLEGGHTLLLRPSGTEPKLKCYVNVHESVTTTQPLEVAKAKAKKTLQTLQTALEQLLK